jgi:hypothetical protein
VGLHGSLREAGGARREDQADHVERFERRALELRGGALHECRELVQRQRVGGSGRVHRVDVP